MARTNTKRDTFPLADDCGAACVRAETILAHYEKARGDSRGDWFAIVARAMADLAILAEVEYGIACGEARAEGGPHPRGFGAAGACDDAAELAADVLRRAAPDSHAEEPPPAPPSIFQAAGG